MNKMRKEKKIKSLTHCGYISLAAIQSLIAYLFLFFGWKNKYRTEIKFYWFDCK